VRREILREIVERMYKIPAVMRLTISNTTPLMILKPDEVVPSVDIAARVEFV
jgi:hypothetical protein